MGLAQSIEQARRCIDRGEIHAAEEITERLRKKARGNAEIQFLEGCIHYKKGDFAGAVDLFRKVVERSPGDVNARVNLGVALIDAGAPDEAIGHLRKVLARRPEHFIGWYNLGNAFRALGRYGEAREAYQQVIARRPDYHPAHNNLGFVSGKLGLAEEAEASYRTALELHPAPDTCINLLHALKRRDPGRTHALIHEAVSRFDDPELYSCIFPSAVNLCAWTLVGQIRDSVLAYAQADGCKAEVLQDLLLPLNSSPGIDPAVMLAIHRNWARRNGRTPVMAATGSPAPAPGGRLRVAYLSGDFSGHAVGLFMRNLLSSHDRERFEILCYSTSGQKDDMTREMTAQVDSFLDVSALDDELLARRIREDGIHLLVDLGGHTMNTRVAVLRHRPAPVQATYLGYPNTTGLAEVDYRITDGYAEAEGGTRYTERLVMLPESFLCFGSFAERPRVEEPPAVGRGYVTFGSFNHTRKLTPEAVRLWSGILKRVPGSRLLIKASLAGESCVQANLYEAFAAEGVGRERVELRGFTETRESHLDCYNEVDIALDTFPYNGTTTTCEALWMGVPVVTLAGKVHAQRVTYSILKNIGVEETIAWTEEEYAEIAVGLARDLGKLAALRARLPGAVRGSILCDPVRFTRQLEQLYRRMWEEQAAAPSHAVGADADSPAALDKPQSSGLLEQARTLLIDGRSAEALVLAERVLQGEPRDINALFISGTACHKLGEHDRAIEALSGVVALAPDFLDARLNLGVVYNETGRHAEAEAQYLALLAMEPRHPIALNNLGKLYHGQLRLDEARSALEASVRSRPDYWVAHFNLGSVLSAQGDYAAAARSHRRSLQIERHPETCAALISVLKKTGAYEEAYRLACEFVEHMDTPVDALLPVASVLYESCAWRMIESTQPIMLAVAADGATRKAYLSSILLDLNTRNGMDPQRLFELHRLWGEKTAQLQKIYCDYPEALRDDERLRIGYLSPDFRSHSVGLFMQAVIAAHDPARVEVFCYAKSAMLDDLSRSIAATAGIFADVSAMNDEAIARRIHADGIHILVDLAGHTSETGLPVLRHRPAPVQATYLGYPNTTGLAEVDYRITDGYAEAEGGTRYTERLVMLPESFLCFGSFAERPRVEEPPAVGRGYVTFGSFNHTRKLTPEAVRLWSGILKRVPGSRLLIKASLAGESCVQANLYEAFAAEGVGRERVELRGFTETRESHLDCYNEVDIALDTFPYNGTTTTCEALWMGVPVVTLAGKVHAQRVTYSILKNIGVEETIAWTEEEYAEIAVGLARDLGKLAALRARLPGAVRGSILCDPVRFTRQLEQLYRRMWEEQASSLLGAVRPGRAGCWVDYVQDKPYIRALLPSWLAYMEGHAGTELWLRRQQALDLYVEAQAEDVAGRREKLMHAYFLVSKTLGQQPGLCAGQTFLRIALELGETGRALSVLQGLISEAATADAIDLSEPFLPALAGYEQAVAGADSKHWVLAGLLELRDRLLAGVAEYDDGDAAEALELIEGLGYRSDYVHGRRLALRARSGIKGAAPAAPAEMAADALPVIVEAPHSGRQPQQRPIRVMHNLARSGGTLMARCLGCMQDVVLLSEIHPKGSTRFNPITQAQEWYQLFEAREMSALQTGGRMNFVQQLDLIEQRCHDLGKNLVVRDWAHVDFHAVPFARQPTNEFTTANVLEFSGLFRLYRAAVTRHPIDQWLSLSRLALVRGKLTLEDFLRGYLRYAEQCARTGFVRYEDFVAHPGAAMERLCGLLELPYDDRFIHLWPDYDKITGDTGAALDRREIRPQSRRELTPDEIRSFAGNADYRAALEILRYRHPR
ncbi:MAG: tetratricopeptide repeat protein [Gammaproteobacteria bacterium]